MTQTYNENIYQKDHIISTDMQNMENNFTTLKSMFSGTDAPANTEVGMPWYDTDNKIQKFRNYNDSTWLCILPLDTIQKIWIYRNDVVNGMVVDTSVTDRVLGIKSAITPSSYNLTPGNSMASWLNMIHTHGPGSFIVDTYHTHYAGSGSCWQENAWWYHSDPTRSKTVYQGSTTQAVAGTSASGTGSTWRPSAAVGTLQKMS